MNVSTVAYSAYQNAIDSVSVKTADSNRKSSSSSTAKRKSDSLEISREAYDLQSKNENVVAKSGKDYYGTSSGGDNVIVIHLTDSAMVSRLVQRGYITINGVRLDLSEDVKSSLLETDEQAQADRENAFWMNINLHNMQVAKQQGEVYQQAAKDEAKALETASRIARGGKVPSEDERKLMEYSPELYAMAKSQAMMAKQHKKYKSLYDDEEKTESSDQTVDSDLKTYHTTMSVSMGDSPQIQSVSETEVQL